MVINTNVAALRAAGNLKASESALQSSIEKLSSGFRINHASDDAAGLSIANKLRADGRSLMQASRNASQATAMLQISEGAVTTISGILDRMKELATQAGSDNVDASGRVKIQAEFGQLRSEIDRIVNTTKYQGQKLVDGTFGSSVDTATSTLDNVAAVNSISLNGTAPDTYTLDVLADGKLTITNSAGTKTEVVDIVAGSQIVTSSLFGFSFNTDSAFVATAAGSQLNTAPTLVVAGGAGGAFMVSSSGSYTTDDLVSVTNVDLKVSALGLTTSDLATSTATAQAALTAIDNAISTVNSAIGTLGAAQSRIAFAQQNVASTVQNVAAAESTIRDADVAEVMTQFTKQQILQQAGTAMLAQANSAPQTILSLIRG